MTRAQLSLGNPVENSVGMLLVPIPAGEFLMGSPASKKGNYLDESQHSVEIGRPFYLGVTEVTNLQYERVMAPEKSKK